MVIRITADTLKKQLELSGTRFPPAPYQQAILNHQIPLSIGGGIGMLGTL